MIVVAVFTMSCQVSLKPNIGPDSNQTRMEPRRNAKRGGPAGELCRLLGKAREPGSLLHFLSSHPQYFRRRKYCPESDLNVVLGRCPGADADPHRLAALPAGSAAPAVARFLERCDHSPCALVVAERDNDLVQDDIVQDFDASQRELVREPAGLIAVTVDQFGEPASAELPQRRPDIDAARAARAVRREIDGVTMLAEQEVVAGDGHRGPKALGLAHKGDAGVVRHVEPLVRVGRKGIGGLESGHQMRALR